MSYDSTDPGDLSQFAGLAYASPAYAAANGFPKVQPGESLQSYLNRIYPGTHWVSNDGLGSQFNAAIDEIGGAGISAALTAVGDFAASALPGVGAMIQGFLGHADTLVQAGLAQDAKDEVGGSSGKTYLTPSAGMTLYDAVNLAIADQKLAAINAAATQDALFAEVAKENAAMAQNLNLVIPKFGSSSAGTEAIAAMKSASSAVGLSPAENNAAVDLARAHGPTAPAPTAAPAHFWQKPLFHVGSTPVSIAETGVGVGLLAGIGMLVRKVL